MLVQLNQEIGWEITSKDFREILSIIEQEYELEAAKKRLEANFNAQNTEKASVENAAKNIPAKKSNTKESAVQNAPEKASMEHAVKNLAAKHDCFITMEKVGQNAPTKTTTTAKREPLQPSSSSSTNATGKSNCFLIHDNPQSTSIKPLFDIPAQISPLHLKNYGDEMAEMSELKSRLGWKGVDEVGKFYDSQGSDGWY